MKLTQEEKAWILVDCGNSAYSMAITTALLPVIFGMFKNVNSSMDLGYFNSLACILVALLSPILGTIADYKNQKKKFYVFFTLLGVLTTAGLAFVSPASGNWQLLVLLFIISAIGYAGANIFYDAFLVDVTPDSRMDKISSYGFAYGYIASVIPFGISLAVIAAIGMSKPFGYQIGFLITAIWWGVLTLPMMYRVKQKHYIEPEPQPILNSFRRLFAAFKDIKKHKTAFIFLIAYFFYIDGVDTIVKMVVPYATSIIGENVLSKMTLLGILLIIQIIAFPCAIIYGRLAERFSTRFMIGVGIATYLIACVAAYFVSAVWHIFVLGALIASAQGGIQALSRSYFARIIPKENSNEFFGFYNIFGKFSAIIGPAIMAATTTVTGNPRLSIFGIIPLFLIGLAIFVLLPQPKSPTQEQAEAQLEV